MSIDPEIPDVLSVEAEELPETEFDLLVPQIPLEDDPRPAEEADLALVDDLEDFAADELEEDDDETSLDAGHEPVMNWSTGELQGAENGNIALVTGDEAIIERALKALNTPAGEFAIHRADYGSRLKDVLGSGLGGAGLFSEIARIIKEAATVDGVSDVSVDNLRFDPDFERDVLLCTVSLTLDTDEEPVSFDLAL